MRLAPGTVIVFGKIAEIYPNPISAQRQAGGRRAGLKIRSSQKGVDSSPTFKPTNCREADPAGASAGDGRSMQSIIPKA
jgi:hypothetical protein